MGFLGDILKIGTAGKDALLGGALRDRINQRLDFGEVTELTLDSQARRVDLQVQLKGESEAIRVTLADYRVRRDGERLLVEIGSITASREWIAILAQKYGANQPFEVPVPAQYHWALEMLL